MKITIIGASAGIGLLAVQQALAKGHTVTALSRNTTPIPDHPLLTKINGSATSVPDLKRALAGADAVLITIGAKDKKTTTLFTDTAAVLLQVAAETAVTAPILVVTGFGAGASSRYLGWFMGLVIRLLLKHQYHNKTQMEELLTQSSLRWEIVRPGMLTNGPLTRTYQAIPTLYTGMRIGKISRADVADFLLREAENPTMLHQYPALTS